jgi:16S rRNA (guanine527-N7)-methyltransferase
LKIDESLAAKMSSREEFIAAIETNQAEFGLDLSADVIERLAKHFELVTEHNPLLHLTGPATPTEFAIRHVLESLTMLEFLPEGVSFVDVGSGAGFPAIPCLIARDDLNATLIESKAKKVGFLQNAIAECEIGSRTTVVNSQFSETPQPDISCVSCRALDRFSQHLPKLVKWSGDCTLLFFGGLTLRDELQRLGLNIEERLMPLSEQRYLFVSRR